MSEESRSIDGAVSSAGYVEASCGPSTLIDLLRFRADSNPLQSAYTFLADGEQEETYITYADLDERARAIAAHLQSLDCLGQRALLLFPPGLDYIAAFFGCVYSGAIAVPAYPPPQTRAEEKLHRLAIMVEDCGASLILCSSSILSTLKTKSKQVQRLNSARWIATDEIGNDTSKSWRQPVVSSDTLAFLQYTSGSTAAPKGVMISHGNALHNQRLIQRCFRQEAESVIVGWLPLYHDMGLIGNVLHTLYIGARCVLISPTSFLQRPLRWLSAISRYRGTTSGGPNFAYDLCVDKIPKNQRETLDLSSWSTAFNGAEPIRYCTLERFAEAFGPYGFRREAFAPCYGLAEATLIVSGGLRASSGMAQVVESAALEHGKVVSADESQMAVRKIVNCGELLHDQRIEIVDPETLHKSPPDRIGEIWISSPSVAKGYWERPQETAKTFHAHIADSGEGPFLRTGDLGFLKDGQLVVTGRLKDVIIIHGRNVYPQDVELTVERSHISLRKGCGAAFSVDVDNEERLIVIQELEFRHHPDTGEVLEVIRQAVTEEHELQLYAALLIKPGTIPRTTSGKIQRSSCRARYREGSFDVVGEWRRPDQSVNEEPIQEPPSPLDKQDNIGGWLASQLAGMLGLKPSEIDESRPISSYGIDSIMAIEFTHRIETTYGVSLSLVSLLQGASIGQLAASVLAGTESVTSDGEAVPSPSPTGNVASEYPLSYGQQALWFLHQLAPDSAAYNLASAVRIQAEPDIRALRRAFQYLIGRHTALRTTFRSKPGGSPVQRVDELAEVYFYEEDAGGWSEQELNERLQMNAHQTFNLEEGPLLRVNLFKRPAQEYVMLLVFHHIVADFWSLAVLVNELGTLYRAEISGARAELAPLRLEYSDYVGWQAALLASQKGARLRDYWEKQLAGELPALNLPTNRPRPPVQTYCGASRPFEVSAEVTTALKAFCKTSGSTLFMALLAGFQVLLHRYTSQEDVLVGSPTSGRNSTGVAKLVGYFVNPVVLRASFSNNPTFTQFLGQVRETVLAAFEHQDYPFALLVERLQPEREPSRSPIFQAMFIFQNPRALGEAELASFALGESGARMELGGLRLESISLQQRIAQFDLTLSVAEVRSSLAATLEYNTDLFDAEMIGALARHFQTLLESIAADPSRRVSDLPLLTEAERRQILGEWNNTGADYSREKCVHELFEQQTDRTPDAIAIVSNGYQLSYGELNRRANQLAHYLCALGVRAETRVGIIIERSVDMLLSMLGVLKAGGAYVPLDPAYPVERLLFMLKESAMPVLIAQRRLAFALPDDLVRVDVDAEWRKIGECSEANFASGVVPENAAYVIYTSGSTGSPKGVVVSNRNVVNFFTAMDNAIGAEPPGVLLAVTSISFDISVLELLWTLARGFSVVVQGERGIAQVTGEPDENTTEEEKEKKVTNGEGYLVTAQIIRHQVSHLQCTPSMAKMLSVESDSLEALSRLRKLLIGGEAFPIGLAETLKPLVRGEILNMYGPTETTVWSTTHLLNGAERKIPIGRPIANTQIYILDRDLKVVPVGVPGELYIGGKGVVRGYLGQSELTAERFLPDLFGAESGARLYRTGDVARFLTDGKIEFMGRGDHQVKIRGYRIEPAEIEAALTRHPSVREAAVQVRQDSSGEPRLVAYLVPGDGSTPNVNQLRGFLKEILPESMAPSSFVMLASLPLTPSGKVDRRALPEPDRNRPELEKALAHPRNAVEEVLAVIWAETLDIDQVGIHDDFFELGGHSILATQLLSRLRETLEVGLPLRTFFQNSTVAGVAEAILEEPIQRTKAERIARLIIDVAQYSDDQVEAMLRK